MKYFILGGARSGKSALAEQAAKKTQKNVIYIATGQALDTEMSLRIERHQKDRDAQWKTVEEPYFLANTLRQVDSVDNCILVDCLTLWITNCLLHREVDFWDKQKESFINALLQCQSDLILVSNEVGQGIVPLGEVNRRFVDESGRLHQQIAQLVDQVTWVVAGLPQTLKGK